ncbi:MAG: RHS repeat-associated core domain-containing protein [Candidatus Parabeggiatoa sp.]|nr:RHS repeat-associated core domain-containing protein [Candidatus Parabeggiatoa sp.]
MTLLKTVTVALLWIFSISQSALASVTPSNPIGTIQGSFSVDSNGAAAYLIPLTVPPGTNDVTPELTLTYNSHQKNGYMGMGWTLNGVSSITRCPYTLNRDSETEFSRVGVTLTYEDHFCLDGINLILVEGQYGKEGSVYHTEKETWTKIIAHGQCGNGPCSFEAYNKDGAKLEFATTTDSQILATGRTDGTVQVWSLARYTDLNGNYTQVSYFDQNGEYYPVRIDYTGNDRVEPKLSPQRSVQFEYADRDDVIVSYVAGSKAQITKRLTHLKTFVNTQLGLDYRFEYEYSGVTQLSRLTQLKQCDAKGVCLPTTGIEWQGHDAPQWESPQLFETGEAVRGHFVSIDVTGDGKANDLVNIFESANTAHFLTYIAQENGEWQAASDFNTGTFYRGQWLTMDVNGDARTDIVNLYESAGVGYLLTYLATDENGGWEKASDVPYNTRRNFNDKWLTLDINGDGQVDMMNIFVSAGTEHFVTYWATGNGNWEQAGQSFNTGQPPSSDEQWLPMDVNGNGMTDLVKVFLSGGTEHFLPFLTTGDGEHWDSTGQSYNTRRSSTSYWLPMDVNGDGKADMVNVDVYQSTERLFTYLTMGNGNWELVLDTGFDTRQNTGGQFLPLDVNGDGLADIVNIFNKTNVETFATYLTTEAGTWEALADFNTQQTYQKDRQWLPMDVNGQGITNLVKIDEYQNQQRFMTYLSTPDEISDLLTSITNGLNGSTTVDYAALTGDDEIYTVGHDAVYPVRDVQNPMYVVKTYTNHDGLNGDGTHEYRYSYLYTGAQTDVRGRDWLGFRTVNMTEVKMTEEAYGRSSITTYRQDYPYNGNIEKSEAQDGQGNLLTRNASEYTLLTPHSGVYQVLVAEETMSHYTNNVLDYTLQNKSQYDGYGNLKLTEELGNIADPDDEVYKCARYINDESLWRLGYMEQAKTTKTVEACNHFLGNTPVWDENNDVLWEQFAYDTRMNVVLEGKWYDNPLKPNESGKWVNSTFVVDPYGNRTESTDPLGNKTVIAYETTYHSFPETITSPPNAQGVKLVTTEYYEPLFGTKIQRIDVNGNTMRYEVDGFGRSINTYGPNLSGQNTLISTVTYATDTQGIYVKTLQRPAWETSNQSEWYWEKSYQDGLEREYRTEKRGNADDTTLIEEKRYNAEGHIGQQSLPYFKKDSASWVSKQYDVYNRPTLTTAPDGTQEKIEYAQGGLQVARTYAYNTPDCRTETTYSNARDLVIQRVESNQLSTAYTYNKLDKLISLTTTLDASSASQTASCPTATSDSASNSDARTVTFVYDSLERIVSKETANTGVDLLDYDDADNLLLRTDAEGNLLAFSYDDLNRVLTKTSTVGNQVTTSTFTYDESSHQNGQGNLTSLVIQPPANLSLQNWQYAFGYDAYDERITGQVSMAAGTYSYAIEYDPMDRMRKYTYPDGTTQVLDYADDSNVSTLALQGETGPYVTYSQFNALGEVEQIAYKNGLNITRSHYPIAEELGKLKSIQAVSSQQPPLFSKQYQWNKINAITAITDLLDDEQNESFGYHDDANNPQMGFLTQAEGAYETENYRYKKLGNLEQNNNTQYTYQTGTDKLESDNQGGTFSYYSNGNLKEKVSGGVTWQYDYDAEGQLLTTRQGEQSGHAFYDYNGNRLYQQPVGQSVKTYYVTPNYEVTDFGNGKVEHTKYIEGLFGRAVAITNSGTGVASAIAHNNARMQAKGSDGTTTWANSLFAFSPIGLVARLADSPELNMSIQLWPGTVTRFLSHPDMAQWLNIAMSSLVLMVGFLFCLLLLVRGASEDSVIGKARITSICFLARIGWISAKKASLWQQTQQTAFGRDNPYKAAVLPFIVATFFCTYGTMTEAALVPGDNGAGYPVQGTYYFVQNHVDSTVLVTDSQGAQTAKVAYLPFGEIDQNNSTGTDNFRPKFSGKEWDADKQLYYFEARYYDPLLAQFTTPDPAQQYINPYLYASNSPQSHIDQNGELAFLIAVIVIGAVVGAYMGASAVNGGSLNPAEWDWKSGKTWAGLFGGAAIGAVSGAASAGLASSASLAVSIAGHALLGAVENAAFTAMGGGSLKDIAISGATGIASGAFGGAMAGRTVGKATTLTAKKAGAVAGDTALDTVAKTTAKTGFKETLKAAKKTVTESKAGQFVSKVAKSGVVTKATEGKTGKAVSIAGGVLMGAAQNSASTALEGGSAKDILISGGVGGVLGGASSTQSQFRNAHAIQERGGVYSLTDAAKKSDKSVANGKYTYQPRD